MVNGVEQQVLKKQVIEYNPDVDKDSEDESEDDKLAPEEKEKLMKPTLDAMAEAVCEKMMKNEDELA